MTATELLVWGIVAHLVADWFFQNDWQAVNKVRPLHSPAAWVHAGCHFAAMLFVFAWPVALGIAASHLLIDTRRPLQWWRSFMGQAKDGNPLADHVKIWQDQVAHVVCIAVAAGLVA